MGRLFNELKRRNVFRVAVAYLVGGWLVLQVSQLVLEAIDAPSWVIQVFLLAFAVGLPFALLFSWAYELTPEGIKRENKVDRTKDEAAFRKLTEFFAGAIEKRRATRPDNIGTLFDQADLAVITGMDDVVFENIAKIADAGPGVGPFRNPLYAPPLEQERFRMLNKILTDGVNEERAKLGTGTQWRHEGDQGPAINWF